MAIKITGPNLPPAPEPRDKGKVPPVRSDGKGAAKSPSGTPSTSDGISITPLAKALSVLEGMEEVRPGALDAAKALIDEQGNILNEDALRIGVSRLLQLLQG